MKKHILAVFASAFAVSTFAAQLSPSQALARLSNNKALTETLPVYTASAGEVNTCYVFNFDSGFVIVSADDVAQPLLGYSDCQFDVDNIPDGLQDWLEMYSGEIIFALENDVTASATVNKSAASDIEPMLTTQWAQSSPYNSLCPTYSGKTCVTGCVATAMAQVMNFHKWPAQGTGSYSYTWNSQTLSMDFSEVTFNWDSMTDDDIALLMKACGYSVNMLYGTSASSATAPMIAKALITYFDYDLSAQYVERDFYSDDEWNSLIYNELASSRPVLFCGVSASGVGHEFILDGYSDGYYHVNWGWGGTSDGYFLLSALDPQEQGTGGSTSGYNYNQSILVGVQPQAGTVSATNFVYATDDFCVDQTSYNRNRSTTAQVFTSSNGLLSNNVTSTYVNFGLKFTSTDGSVQYVKCTYDDSQLLSYDFSIQINSSGEVYRSGISAYYVQTSAMPSSGTYVVTPACYVIGSSDWDDVHIVSGNISKLQAVCTTNSVVFSQITESEEEESQTTSIANVATEQTIKAIYDVAGRELSQLQSGLNIIVFSDNSVVKILVK